MRGPRSLDGLSQDLRYAFRTLSRDPAFTLFGILIVGLGIGASSSLFNVVNALLLRPLPFSDPERLVWIANKDSSGLSGQTTQVGHMLDLQARNRSFSGLAGYFAFYGVGDMILTGRGEPERLSAVPVSANFFQVLGVQPHIGRLFTPEECKWNGPKAVLLNYGLWERRFGSDPSIIGRALTLNGEPVTVAGVLPASFDFAAVFAPGSRIELITPFPLSPETNRWGNTMAMIGRLKPRVSVPGAGAELRVLADQITRAHPERNTFEGHLSPLAEHVSGRMRVPLLVLAGAVGVVMLIVCANLSNLLLARMAARQREIAIRTALGAGRMRLLRQTLTEGLVLSCSGAALGFVLAVAGTRAVARLEAFNIPLLSSVRMDGWVLVFTVLLALATGIVFGIAPAFQVPARAVQEALKDTSRGTTEGRHRSWLRGWLVVSEVAFACVLLVCAGLLIRSFVQVLNVNLGFRPERAASVRVDPPQRPSGQAQANAYFDDVLRRARAIPGIEAAGLSDALPLGRNRSWGAGEKGQVYPKGQYPVAFVRVVSDGYFGAMRIPLRAGRDFTERDTPATEPVIVINGTMARTLFAGREPLGKIIRACGERRIVGVSGDVRHLALEQGAGMEMYLPIRQCDDFASLDLVVRTALPPAALATAVRAALRPVAPDISGQDFRTLRQLVDKAVSPRRFVVWMLAGFALFALLLASLGMHAVISYSVGRREHEIGIRMALGASAGKLQARIILQTLRLAALGALAGAAASWVAARALRGLLFGVSYGDPATFLGTLAVLLAVAAIAGYLPARRASRIDPAVTLRAN